MEEELTVTVKLLFQPAEECIEDSGAGYMKEDPEAFSCDRMIALHIWSKLPAGTASLRYGAVMTATDTFDIFVKGKGRAWRTASSDGRSHCCRIGTGNVFATHRVQRNQPLGAGSDQRHLI